MSNSLTPFFIFFNYLTMSKFELEDTPDILRTIFEYKDGNLFWKVDPRDNKRHIGDKAGGIHKGSGYEFIKCDGIRYPTHRLIWVYHKGLIPEGYTVDHDDRIRNNNDIENLRLATPSEQGCNKSIQENNISGHIGVSWSEYDKRWRAQITKDGKRVKKSFTNKADAIAWREAKTIELHREFAN